MSYITDAGGSRHQIDSTVYDNDGNIKRYIDTANRLTTEYDYDDKTDSDGHMSKLSIIFKTISVIAFVVALAAATVASGGGAGFAFAGYAVSGGTAAAAVAGDVAIGAASVGTVFAAGAIHQDVTEALSNSEFNKHGQEGNKGGQ